MTDWKWFALRVEPAKEWAVEQRLTDVAFIGYGENGEKTYRWHTLVPLRHISVNRRGARRKLPKAVNQMPGYVFIRQKPDTELPWLEITECHEAIIGVLTNQGTPVEVPEPTMLPTIVRQILLESRLSGRLKPIRRKKGGRRGSEVEIMNGPYKGRIVKVIELQGEDPELYGLFKEVKAA